MTLEEKMGDEKIEELEKYLNILFNMVHELQDKVNLIIKAMDKTHTINDEIISNIKNITLKG